IETNPALTHLKQFMSSDYLLSNLGYNPDESAKRLGDGFYEQKLIQQAMVARTGQRFIDGQDSNEKLFKHLMDNALQSKQQLDLSVGVTLTSEQVAALTHDIVWLESHEVNGEQVLVPVLYLAQANNRLAPNGSLIAGKDVSLIAGKDLNNVGTLRAANDLSAVAGENLVNSGLAEAGKGLNLTAGKDLLNKAGGVIAGRDVALTATDGDVVNERTLTSHQSNKDSFAQQRDFVDSAARIEAANNLTINAGRDFNNSAGVLKSAADTSITAGRDVSLTAVEQVVGNQLNANYRDKSVTQHGSTLEAGRDLSISAGRDITAIASQIEAKSDVSMSAKENLTLASAANEQHWFSQTKSFKGQEDHGQQVSTILVAGGNVALKAGEDLQLTASRVTAGDEAYLYAGNDLNLNTAENSDYSYYSKTKKGSWGKKKSTMTESGSEEAVSSVIQAQGKTMLVAANDVNISGSSVNSDKGALSVLAGHDVNLEAAQNSQFSASEKSKSGGFGLSSTSKKSTDASSSTSLTGSTLSGNTTLVQAGNDLLVSASNVVSTEQTNLQAGKDIRIESGIETFSSQHSQSTSKSGLMSSGGIGVTLGSSKNSSKQDIQGQTEKGSTIGSVLGDVVVTAGKDLTVKASDVVAGKDISLIGQNVSIIDGESKSSTHTQQESKKSGLTLALSGVVGSAVNTAVQTVQDVRHEDDSRLAALQGIKAGLSGYQAWQGAQAVEAGAQEGSFFGISLSLGTQKSSSKQVQEQSVSQGTGLTAGNDLRVIATGNGPSGGGGDLSVIGGKLQAGHDVLLSAARDIDLRAGANTQKLEGSNKSGGGAIGVSLGVGSGGGGLSVFANANSGVGKEKGNGTTWTETTVNAGNQLTLNSGRDTTLEGAQANAQKVVADIGRNLTLTSLQDSDRFDSKQ
ncbi:hemagglutinin repeat-containing protein, partial [Pseudomonas protegens]|uniref:hemagglutinin repeat-containing protein n=1 Tax=Pseudomonas protegens TaxID=380021 RepID=UPI00385738FC